MIEIRQISVVYDSKYVKVCIIISVKDNAEGMHHQIIADCLRSLLLDLLMVLG
jgi:hypothetical protein